MATTTNPTYDAAVKYADAGFTVIPIHSAHNGVCSCKDGAACPPKQVGKHPMRLDWQRANQPGEPAMRNWWDNDKPKNIGIATGAPSGGLLVVDVDGEAGIASMKKLTEEHGRDWLNTLTVKTGGGGWHFYFRMDPAEKIGNSAGTKLGKGIDTRGTGGYVIAAPSASKKGAYKITADKPVADAPDWLLEALRPKVRKTDTNVTVTDVSLDLDDPEHRRLIGYTQGAIEHEVSRLRALHHDGPISSYMGLPWNNTVFEVSANLIQLANADWCSLTPEQAYACVYEAAPRDADFGDEVINRTFDSAKSKVDGNPAGYPPKPVDLLEHFAGSDLNSSASIPGNQASSVHSEAAFSGGEQSAEVNDGFVSNVGEPEAIPTIEIPTLEGIPVLHDRLDPGHAERALAEQLGKRYVTGAAAEITYDDDYVIELDNLIDRPVVHGSDARGLGEIRAWVDKHLRSSAPETFWEALGAIVAGTDTDGPTIVFKGAGAILAALATTLNPRIGAEPESMLFGPTVSTKDVDGPHILFAFDDEPCPPFEPLALIAALRKAKAGTPLPPPADDEDELAVRLPDYRAVLLERTRLGLAPQRREGVTDDAS